MPNTRSGGACKQLRMQQAEVDRDDAEEQTAGGQREGDRVAEHQKTTNTANISGVIAGADQCRGEDTGQ